MARLARTTLSAIEEKLDALVVDTEDGRKDSATCQEETKAHPEQTEPNPVMMQSVGEHQEVPKEKAAVRLSGALK
jgi:hypothetical protein